MKKDDSIGRMEPVKAAFLQYLLKGVDELIPVTPALVAYSKRQRETKVGVCPARMVDQVEELLKQYQRSPNDDSATRKGINAPLPVLLVAFAKDANPIAPDRGISIPNEQWVRLENDPFAELYRMRLDHVENRVQIAFIAHEDESTKALTSQMRLYLQKFSNHRWPIEWHFGGNDFSTTCSLESYEPMDEVADLPDRTNLTILLWNITLNFQIPYLRAPDNDKYNKDGKRVGYTPVREVNVTVDHVKKV